MYYDDHEILYHDNIVYHDYRGITSMHIVDYIDS